MHDEDAFLRAIQAEPQNDLRKLVYADWLEEQGREGEGAFIRETAEGKESKVWTRWQTPDERVGKAWWDLYRGAERLWDTRTLLALGRLQGMLDALAAANDHTSDVHHNYSATVEPQMGTAEKYGSRLGERGIALVGVDDWQTVVRDEAARWIGIHRVHSVAEQSSVAPTKLSRGASGRRIEWWPSSARSLRSKRRGDRGHRKASGGASSTPRSSCSAAGAQ